MAKLKENNIKKKIRSIYGQFQIINPEFLPDIYTELSQLIRNNSVEVKIEDDLGKVLKDTQVKNTVQIIRYMLSELTNIESKEYWNSIDDIQLDEMLNHADGDFKEAIQTLMDVMFEISHDNTRNDIRQVSIITDKLVELKESMISTTKMQQTLNDLGLDIEKLIKIQQGDEVAIKEFQENIIRELEKQNKPKAKRGRPKNKK